MSSDAGVIVSLSGAGNLSVRHSKARRPINVNEIGIDMAQYRRKVVWFEGMTLDPHHLQQWDSYHQSSLNARIGALTPYGWGFTEIEIDRERLANGDFRLLRCRGVLPDGLLFDMPDHDPLPPSKNIQESFPATLERLPVYLTIPSERRSGSNIMLQNGPLRREMRFAAETISVLDENTGADERQIQVARPNFQLQVGNDSLETYTNIQVAEVVRDIGGGFSLNEQFIPPSLSVGASSALMSIVRRLLELLVTKSTSLSERARGILAQRELSPADTAVLGLLGAINTHIPLVKQHFAAAGSHPEALFLTMSTLAGQLSVFVPESRVHPRDYPVYDHANPTDCFGQLDAILREMLGGAKPPSNYVQIALEKQRENIYVASVDEELLSEAQFFLIARSDQYSEEKLIAELPVKLRIASPQTINAVLQSVIRALPIEHTSRLPAGLPVDAQANYFQLQKRGPFWEAIRESGGLAIFVPSDLSLLDFKLVAVQKA